MSKATYDKLSDTDKQAFAAATRYSTQLSRDDVERDDGVALAELSSSFGMKINTDIDKAAFQAGLVAVGTGLATRPPRRSRRAQFGHRAPISGE